MTGDPYRRRLCQASRPANGDAARPTLIAPARPATTIAAPAGPTSSGTRFGRTPIAIPASTPAAACVRGRELASQDETPRPVGGRQRVAHGHRSLHQHDGIAGHDRRRDQRTGLVEPGAAKRIRPDHQRKRCDGRHEIHGPVAEERPGHGHVQGRTRRIQRDDLRDAVIPVQVAQRHRGSGREEVFLDPVAVHERALSPIAGLRHVAEHVGGGSHRGGMRPCEAGARDHGKRKQQLTEQATQRGALLRVPREEQAGNRGDDERPQR